MVLQAADPSGLQAETDELAFSRQHGLRPQTKEERSQTGPAGTRVQAGLTLVQHNSTADVKMGQGAQLLQHDKPCCGEILTVLQFQLHQLGDMKQGLKAAGVYVSTPQIQAL